MLVPGSMRFRALLRTTIGVITLAGATSSCSAASALNDLSSLACTIPTQFIADGGPGKDRLASLTNPTVVTAEAPGAGCLRDDDWVVGVAVGDKQIAVPLTIGWWHEEVSLDRGALRLSVTHCPLTGSSLVVDRSATGGVKWSRLSEQRG